MKVAIMSDLHLEFGRGDLKIPECDLLLLAGDIFVPWLDKEKQNYRNKLKKRYRKFFEEVSEKCGVTLMCLGNHEHYQGVFNQTASLVRDTWLSPYENIHLLDNEVYEMDDLMVFGGTMWTDMNKEDPLVMHTIRGRMNDFQLILQHQGTGGYMDPSSMFLPRHAAQESKFTKAAIREFLTVAEQKEKFAIVMTHHAPSWACVQPHYRSDLLTYAYANTDLDTLILDDGPGLWIHGHMHKRDLGEIGNTRVICNARGYFGYDVAAAGYEAKIINLEFDTL